MSTITLTVRVDNYLCEYVIICLNNLYTLNSKALKRNKLKLKLKLLIFKTKWNNSNVKFFLKWGNAGVLEKSGGKSFHPIPLNLSTDSKSVAATHQCPFHLKW